MQKFLVFYTFVIIIIFAVNFIRYVRCLLYQIRYNNNFKINMPQKNYNIKYPIISLLKKGHSVLISPDIDIIANELFISDINTAFENAKGYFKYQMLHSPFWIFTAIENFSIFAPISKTKNKITSLFFAIIESFVVYLLGLYLDTTGIGNKILTSLLSFLTALFEHLEEFLH